MRPAGGGSTCTVSSGCTTAAWAWAPRSSSARLRHHHGQGTQPTVTHSQSRTSTHDHLPYLLPVALPRALLLSAARGLRCAALGLSQSWASCQPHSEWRSALLLCALCPASAPPRLLFLICSSLSLSSQASRQGILRSDTVALSSPCSAVLCLDVAAASGADSPHCSLPSPLSACSLPGT
jgi:hypothetical protein